MKDRKSKKRLLEEGIFILLLLLFSCEISKLLASPYMYSKISFYSLRRCPLSSEGCSYLVVKYLQQSEKMQKMKCSHFPVTTQTLLKIHYNIFERKADTVTQIPFWLPNSGTSNLLIYWPDSQHWHPGSDGIYGVYSSCGICFSAIPHTSGVVVEQRG